MGRLFSACSRSPSFGTVTTSAFFQARGNWPVSKEVLKIEVIDGRITGRLSFITRTEILSWPGALFVGIELMIFWISSESTGLNVNCSDAGYSLGIKGACNKS